MQINKILIATDSSKPACNAADEAVKLAASTGATLTGVFVIPEVFPLPIPGREMMFENRVPHDTIRKEGEETLSQIEKQCNAEGVEFGGLILHGHPVNEIVSLADDLDADVIVVGCLGRTGLDRFLLGSVAENVLRHSKRPVLMVR